MRENTPEPPSATTKGKRRRPPSPQPNKSPKKRQRTDNPTNFNPNLNTLPPAVDPSNFQPEKREKPFACPFATDTDDPCSTRLGRETDIRRHVRTKHLGYRAFCAHEIHRGKPFELSREDGVLRHLAFRTCIGAAALEELVEERKNKDNEKDAGVVGNIGNAGNAGNAKIARDPEKERLAERQARRAVSKDCTLCRMPCYHTRRFWRGIKRLPGETPDSLERWFAKYGRVERCPCGPCQNISEAELRGEVKVAILDEEQPGDTHPSPSATAESSAGLSSSGAVAPAPSTPASLGMVAIEDDAEWDDDKLPPEEEEGVEEDIPEMPLAWPAADAGAVAAQDSDINDPHVSEDAGGMPPDLQTVYEILSGLPDEDLESFLHGSETPDGKADA